MRKGYLLILMVVALTVSACSGVKTTLLKSSQIAEVSMGQTQDTFYQTCFGMVPKTPADKPAHCLASSGISDAALAKADGAFSRFFGLQIRVVTALETWQAGQPKPTDVDGLVAEANNVLDVVQALAPGAIKDALLAKINAVIADVATIVKQFTK